MTTEMKRDYRYLDSQEDRVALVEDIRRVRREVLKLADMVPKDKLYEPRYHGWSLAAMLGHLQLMDRLLLWLIQLALIGVQLPLPLPQMNRFNDLMARVFQRRVIETTARGIQKKEAVIADFIFRLPIDTYSKQVYDPASETYLTVEQALQEFFLYHWQDHLQTMRQVDDIHYEPPSGSNLG